MTTGYPAITSMLTRLPLEIDSGLIRPPMEALLIRFPKDPAKNTLRFGQHDEHRVRSILMSEASVRDSKGITLWIDLGERISDPRVPSTVSRTPIYTYRNFRCVEGRNVEDDVRDLPMEATAKVGLQLPVELERDLVRLACTLCLLGNDPTILEPDVLSKDRAKWEATRDPKFVDKARQRGKKGWLVGAHVEVIPHVRRPHPALVWTGKGRAVPRIVMRKGSIVHRNVVERVPTGHSVP
jgi:hypothetical protein